MVNLVDIKDSKDPEVKFDNRYRLIKKIGGGGFSEVWLAHDTNADMDVALKIYTPNGELDEEGKEDFKKEFARLCGLNHSNIIHAIGFGIHDDELPYLAMSVCKNGSAKKLIGHYEEKELWTFIEQVALGLKYLHDQVIRCHAAQCCVDVAKPFFCKVSVYGVHDSCFLVFDHV